MYIVIPAQISLNSSRLCLVLFVPLYFVCLLFWRTYCSRRCHHCRRRAANFRPILGTYCLWAGGHTCRDMGLQMLKTPADVSPNRHGYICAIVQVCLILSAIKLDRLVSSPAENLSPISRDVIITGAGLQPLRRFSAVTASREGSLPCPAYCDTWPRLLWHVAPPTVTRGLGFCDLIRAIGAIYSLLTTRKVHWWPILTWFSMWTWRK